MITIVDVWKLEFCQVKIIKIKTCLCVTSFIAGGTDRNIKTIIGSSETAYFESDCVLK